jgi:hypothetical protein
VCEKHRAKDGFIDGVDLAADVRNSNPAGAIKIKNQNVN